MDINDLDICAAADAGATFELLHPGTGKPTGVHLTVRGYDSVAVEEAGRDANRAAMRSSKRPEPSESIRVRRIAMARASLMDVKGGTGSTKTADDLRKLMDRPGHMWVIEQIENFAGDRGSFFRSAETP